MLVYPELYFARFVLLVEGDSERIVLPCLAESLDLLIDPAFVAIVPLGGRHVQHFWRLLTQLGIPYATLLDLDLGRQGGGFGRIKTSIEKLLDIGVPKSVLLELSDGKILSDAELAKMHTWNSENLFEGWVDRLKRHGVYFSAPLDLDLSMLKSFPEAYQEIIPQRGGPRITNSKAMKVVLGATGKINNLYAGQFKDYFNLFPAYRYHFLTHSKPATHLAALTNIEKMKLKKDMPPVLKELLEHITNALRRN